MSDYNGWTNWATWEAYNIIANSDYAYACACGLAMRGYSAQDFAEAFGELVEGDVNWEEIAEAFSCGEE